MNREQTAGQLGGADANEGAGEYICGIVNAYLLGPTLRSGTRPRLDAGALGPSIFSRRSRRGRAGARRRELTALRVLTHTQGITVSRRTGNYTWGEVGVGTGSDSVIKNIWFFHRSVIE